MVESIAITSQLHASHQSALLVPAQKYTMFRVGGIDRQTWLNGLLTCDLLTRSQGAALYGLILAPKGKVLTDLFLVERGEEIWLILPLVMREEVQAFLDRHLIMEEVEILPYSGPFEIFFIHGPRAVEVMKTASAEKGWLASGVLDRTGLGGALCVWDPSVFSDGIHPLRKILDEREGIWGDTLGWEILRIERGIPVFGIDFDGTSYPQEAGLDKTAVSFSKGCYLGQEVVCMLELRGQVKKKLMRLAIQGDSPPPRGAELTNKEGMVVGSITSSEFHPGLDHVLALGWVKRSVAELGGPLQCGTAGVSVIPLFTSL
ncbi:YgfZ/GcvT domain-containing protein [Pajaroellobacter abortibovis]|uniref:Aminomethyltransferase folate-binding domain-containing protein n=1 Tax=Pajaroellobacter abortibovis TaxID=1882918 RepID=A0A1L6MVR8_9BACT|nr:glycine cleavage T C-terminal barrel domain-containing protein [Pajaroellobacter abortibovis]APR99616.1 hypothetical protein BCY86_02170 [Pajaroellobacter abortibovis]